MTRGLSILRACWTRAGDIANWRGLFTAVSSTMSRLHFFVLLPPGAVPFRADALGVLSPSELATEDELKNMGDDKPGSACDPPCVVVTPAISLCGSCADIVWASSEKSSSGPGAANGLLGIGCELRTLRRGVADWELRCDRRAIGEDMTSLFVYCNDPWYGRTETG